MHANNRDHRVFEPGPLAPWIDQFAAKLSCQGYTPLTIGGYTDSARHFAAWLRIVGVPAADIDGSVVHRFAEHQCQCCRRGGRRRLSVSPEYSRRVGRFVDFLQKAGVVPLPLKKASPYPLLDDYQRWLSVHRGLSERTIARHRRDLCRLLPDLGTATLEYDAAGIRKVIREWRERTGPSNLRTIASALRCFLRFLAGAHLARPNLDHAVPTVIQWRLSSLPRYLAAADVERVIASCNQLTKGRLRNKAILLLLARLGLRAGDVAGLKLGDIDWLSGHLRLSGKARREVRLPLPQEVGDALLAYIEQERPHVHEEAIFLVMVAPYGPFSQASYVSNIVALALKRAGISDPPSTGASLLRHSAATTMLRAGATLEAVGAMLRHRSIDMTAHYAKVDIRMLEQICQPWPGELIC